MKCITTTRDPGRTKSEWYALSTLIEDIVYAKGQGNFRIPTFD
jgi:hypothetical protein